MQTSRFSGWLLQLTFFEGFAAEMRDSQKGSQSLEASTPLNSSFHFTLHYPDIKGTLMGTPNREPQEYSRNEKRI